MVRPFYIITANVGAICDGTRLRSGVSRHGYGRRTLQDRSTGKTAEILAFVSGMADMV